MTTFTVEDLVTSSKDAQKQLAELAQSVFRKQPSELTKEDVLILLRLELSCIPNSISISVEETRRTPLQYNSWKGGAVATISTTELKMLAESMIETAENTVDGFVKASGYIKAFVVSKMARTEAMLREQIIRTVQADGLEKTPGKRFE